MLNTTTFVPGSCSTTCESPLLWTSLGTSSRSTSSNTRLLYQGEVTEITKHVVISPGRNNVGIYVAFTEEDYSDHWIGG